LFKRLSLLSLLACAVAMGQSTSSLRGVVKDASGASIPDSALTLTDTSTGTLRQVLSNSSAEYQLLQVPPGKYTLKVEKPGFSILVKTDITLEVSVPSTLDCVLEVGAVGSTVNVEADAAQVNTVDASVGNAFIERQVQDLPLQTRNVVELLSIQPGVTQTGEVLGARRDQNNVTLDGVDANNNQTSGITHALINGAQSSTTATGVTGNTPGFNAALPIPLDSVEEFRVTVAGQTADEGRSSGGQVTLVTKSGTNILHGSLYEYNRNTLLAADDFFNNEAGVARSPLVRNQFGASLGGPIVKNRLFLFANWERRIDASSTPETATVPSATLRQGELLAAVSDGTNSSVQTLSPAAVQAIDPKGIGFSPAMKAYLNSFSTGNDPSLSLDNNLNFDGLRFNAPLDVDQSAYVAKLDYNIDQAGKHRFSVRGTLNDAAQDLTAAPLPGTAPAQSLVDNSKGIAASYTWVATPNLINSLKFGITRLGLNETGALGTQLTFAGITAPENFNLRPSIQIMPTTNIADDLTWTKGKHTITTGINFRFIRNTHTNFENSFPSYSFDRNTLGGLGADGMLAVQNYIDGQGNSSLKLTQATAVEEGFGDLLGLINQYSGTYQYTKTGSVIPFGTPAAREYAVNDYEQYVMDNWRVRRNLTITAGLRYSNSTTPWEVNGTEVVTTVPLQTYFAERVAAMNAGIPNNQITDASLTYTLGGSANNKPGWFQRANLNLGPRLAAAYAPDNTDNWFNKLLGKNSVLRGGFAMVYDQYGNDMVFNIDQSGSPGLASTVTQPVNTNFTTSPRYNGLTGLPALPAAAPGGFPFTPPTITGGFNEGVGVVSNLKAPYSLVFNANYAKQLPNKVTIEIGYAGRLYRRGLVQQDFDQPLTNFKDNTSGTTWSQAVGVLHNDYLAAGQTYGAIQPVPFIEDIFPSLANAFVKGSATQNYYYGWININGLSDEDNLNLMDRQRIAGTNKCYTVTGCNTFYPLQYAGLPTWTNAGYSDYNAATISIRRPLSNGFAFDFNYTLSHSIDNSSGAESGAGQTGAILQDAFNVNAFRGSSDFDERHNITADALYELPFGKNRAFAKNSNKFVDALIGGWQASTIFRYHSGLPSTISAGGVYPTNYEVSALTNLLPGATNNFGSSIDNNGAPSLFANTSAAGNYFQQAGGTTGTRAIVRLPGAVNVDFSLMKSFALPWEGHRLQFRAEAFNAFNHVNLYNPILDVNNTGQFGEFQAAQPARVMQMSLRYSF
jgi:hypothetical protein